MTVDGIVKSRFSDVLNATDAVAEEIAKLEPKQRASWIAYIFEALETILSETEMQTLLIESVLAIEEQLLSNRL